MLPCNRALHRITQCEQSPAFLGDEQQNRISGRVICCLINAPYFSGFHLYAVSIVLQFALLVKQILHSAPFLFWDGYGTMASIFKVERNMFLPLNTRPSVQTQKRGTGESLLLLQGKL